MDAVDDKLKRTLKDYETLGNALSDRLQPEVGYHNVNRFHTTNIYLENQITFLNKKTKRPRQTDIKKVYY